VPLWLILILVGVVLVVLGIATDVGQFLIWIGVIVLVVSLILGLVGRSRV
jgi:high-affinity Fe2+/Pb2+ permease